MKRKILAMMLIAMMAVNVTACGSSSDKSAKADKATKETTKDKKEDSTVSEKSDDEMSQAEWVQKYASEEGTEDGYKIVDKINITYNDINISFDHAENYTKTDGSQITFVYFNFTNNSNLEACPATYFNTSAFQNGESIGLYSYPVGDDNKDVYINNLLETVQPGESIQFAEEIDTDDLVSPVKIRVDDANIYNQDMSKQQLQQQEISLQ